MVREAIEANCDDCPHRAELLYTGRRRVTVKSVIVKIIMQKGSFVLKRGTLLNLFVNAQLEKQKRSLTENKRVEKPH